LPLRLHYLDWGGEGKPLVLLHGLASNARIWDLAAPRLADRFRVIAVDQRGHGLSDRPDSEYSFDEVCGDLGALLAALALERPLLVGHSWGGSVVMAYAAANPGGVRGLALVDGGFIPISRGMSWQEAERLMRPPEIEGVDLPVFVNFARNWPHLREVWSPAVERAVLANFLVEEGKVYRRLPVERHMRIVRAMYGQDVARLFPRVSCPVLLVAAVSEPENKEEQAWQRRCKDGLRQAAGLLRRARVREMPNSGHDIPLLRPAELAETLLEFATEL
jgi:pimeloyl-ACP methyl ester carboxylesterase